MARCARTPPILSKRDPAVGEGGLSTSEVGKEIAEHAHHHGGHDEATGRDRVVTIIEAILLAVVAVLAAWSGYASSKWGTESSLTLARASAARTRASRAQLEAMDQKNFDSSTFSAWFTAYVANNQSAMRIAAARFSPEFRVAFNAWIATDPATNPKAPPGPTYMPEYKQPQLAEATKYDAEADALYAEGAKDGGTADDYVRTTVFLATVLFLVGISGHFRVRAARYGLIAVGSAILAAAVVILITSPKPPA
jgi:hypothetical protein